MRENAIKATRYRVGDTKSASLETLAWKCMKQLRRYMAHPPLQERVRILRGIARSAPQLKLFGIKGK